MKEPIYLQYKVYIEEKLETLVNGGRNSFVLYPNGEISKIVERILLDKYGIKPQFFIDNCKYDGIGTLNLKQAKERVQPDTVCLICSDKSEIYDEIRNKLFLNVDKSQIADLFPQVTGEEFVQNPSSLYHQLYFWSGRHSVWDDLNKPYTHLPVILQKAYQFRNAMLYSPIILDKTKIIAYSQVKYPASDGVGAEQLDREIDLLLQQYPEQKALTQDIDCAKAIGMLQHFAGGHDSVDPAVLMAEGFQGRIDYAIQKIEQETVPEKLNFYKAVLICLKAAQNRVLNYAKSLENGLDEERIETDQMKRMRNACENLAYNPPTDFFESIQLLAFIHEFNVIESNGAVSWGIRIDQVLYPYYKRDKEKGLLDDERAIEFIRALWQAYELTGERSANLTLGGSDEYGNDSSNELTILCMEASVREKSDVPLLTLRVHPNLPNTVWEKAIELVRSGQGFPAFYNDVIAAKAMMNAGIDKHDAYNYSTLGCVELTVAGNEFSNTEDARINLLKLLELLFTNGRDQITGRQFALEEYHALTEFQCFEDLYGWYERELVSLIRKVALFTDEATLLYHKIWPTPYLSSISHGCLETGRDITNCGAKYNNLPINVLGMANVVDSFEVIEELVFHKKKFTLFQLKEAMLSDFVESEETLLSDIEQCAKYGNDIDSVDDKVTKLMKTISDTVADLTMINERGHFKCGFYAVMHHALMGEKTLASCDGRRAGTALANSLSPSQGKDTNGPLAVFNSINKVSMDYMGNGGVLDMKFLPSFFDVECNRRAFRSIIETYFGGGGLEVQFNIVDGKVLLDAQKHPEKYRNLVVRVSGYSAYFTGLDRTLQDEIIKRTGYEEAV